MTLTAKDYTIIVLSIGLAICLYFIFNAGGSNKSHPFGQPFENGTAASGIKAYRNTWSGSIYKKTRVITFTEDEINNYMTKEYKALIGKMKLQEGYHWVVGFYMKREDNADGNPRNSFYVVPTMQKDDDKSIIDYYDDMSKYDDGSGISIDKQMSAYDAGHLWP